MCCQSPCCKPFSSNTQGLSFASVSSTLYCDINVTRRHPVPSPVFKFITVIQFGNDVATFPLYLGVLGFWLPWYMTSDHQIIIRVWSWVCKIIPRFKVHWSWSWTTQEEKAAFVNRTLIGVLQVQYQKMVVKLKLRHKAKVLIFCLVLVLTTRLCTGF